MTEEQMRELFREMQDEPVPADSIARVRLRAAERTERCQERFSRHWKLAAVILLPACLVLFAMFLQRSQPVQKSVPLPPVIAKQAEPPAILPATGEPPRKAARPQRHIVKAVSRPANAGYRSSENAGTVIRIETPDPDVVILLIGG